MAIGGIGKTTLANEYARRYWRLYSQILLVDARAGLASGFALQPNHRMPHADHLALRRLATAMGIRAIRL
jgi:hypothetical protein